MNKDYSLNQLKVPRPIMLQFLKYYRTYVFFRTNVTQINGNVMSKDPEWLENNYLHVPTWELTNLQIMTLDGVDTGSA